MSLITKHAGSIFLKYCTWTKIYLSQIKWTHGYIAQTQNWMNIAHFQRFQQYLSYQPYVWLLTVQADKAKNIYKRGVYRAICLSSHSTRHTLATTHVHFNKMATLLYGHAPSPKNICFLYLAIQLNYMCTCFNIFNSISDHPN
jgi:hypothetical protein